MALFAFICVKTTADFVVPQANELADLARKVRLFSRGLVGGVLTTGDIKFRPDQNSVAHHLLCNGGTIARTNYPELVEYLNPGGTTATLPDFTGTLTVTAPTVTQTVSDSGTVSTGEAVTDSGEVGGTTGGNVPSGGRIVPLKLSGTEGE